MSKRQKQRHQRRPSGKKPVKDRSSLRPAHLPPLGKKARSSEGRSGLKRLRATVDKHQRGFAFLSIPHSVAIREWGEPLEDLFVPPHEAEKLFHGDRVEVLLNPNGKIVELKVLEHRFRELVGRFQRAMRGHGGFVVYERKRMREEIPIHDVPKGTQDGDWVRIRLQFQESQLAPKREKRERRGMSVSKPRVTGEVLEVFGPELPARADLQMIAAEYNLEEKHSDAAEREARGLGDRVSDEEIRKRAKSGGDLRKVPFITIDGETARDFDDAIYVERSGNGYLLWVAIADVSHYVRENSSIDREALARGTSVYFPERAFHMLPRALSENLCSLRPHEPRLSLVAKMQIDMHGVIQHTDIMEAVIESKRRATYNEIEAEWKQNGKDPKWEFAAHFELYRLLRKMRSDRGAIDFELPESEVICSPDGEVEAIRSRDRLEAHRLIEQFMLAANEGVTEWMMKRQWPFIYRVHDEPSPLSLQKFQELARTVGVDFRVGEEGVRPKVLAELVKRLEEHPAKELLNTSLLRAMKQAIYSSLHGEHYGLASPAYTHFTSPIRRYPDLLVHRLLRMALQRQEQDKGTPRGPERERMEQDLAEAADHCSYRERIAAEAERESIKLKQVRLMLKHIGDDYQARIVGMVESGLFAAVGVTRGDPYVEGLIHKDTFDDDFYEWNEQRMVFVGRRKRKQFKIGDVVHVQVLRADLDRRQIDFRIVPG